MNNLRPPTYIRYNDWLNTFLFVTFVDPSPRTLVKKPCSVTVTFFLYFHFSVCDEISGWVQILLFVGIILCGRKLSQCFRNKLARKCHENNFFVSNRCCNFSSVKCFPNGSSHWFTGNGKQKPKSWQISSSVFFNFLKFRSLWTSLANFTITLARYQTIHYLHKKTNLLLLHKQNNVVVI